MPRSSILVFAVLIGLGPVASNATGDDQAAQSANHSSVSSLALKPASIQDGRIGLTMIGIQPSSLNECLPVQFCLWSGTTYTGLFMPTSGSGVSRYLSGTWRSTWNNRAYAARLYNHDGTSWLCLSPGARHASLPAAYQSPSRLYLSSSSAC